MKKQIKNFEIRLFNSLAESGKYELSDERLYKFVFDFLRKNNFKPTGNVLEAGCGSGNTGKRFMAKYPGITVTGVDISPEMIKRTDDGTISYTGIVGDLENGKLFKKNTFNIILCFLVLHHFPDLDMVIKNFKKWIKNDGIIIIVEPNGQNLVAKISHSVRMVVEHLVGEEYLIRSQMATPNETNHTLSKYQQLLTQNHFQIVSHAFFYDEPNLPISLSLGSIRTIISRTLFRMMPNSNLFHTTVIILAKV